MSGHYEPATELEWRSSTDSWSMLHVVRKTRPSERKVRLFNAAICRRFWDVLPAASQAILMESELLADGLVPRPADEMDLCCRANAAVEPIDRQYPNKRYPSVEARVQRDAAAAVCYAVDPNDLFGACGYFWDLDAAEKAAHSDVIREVFGNPFRPVKVDSRWLQPQVVQLAEEIYDKRTFDRLPSLADALERNGCSDPEILNHCRTSKEHCRGCCVIDLLLRRG